MKKDMDILLTEALAPSVMPSSEVNERILAVGKKSKSQSVKGAFRAVKVAAAAVAVVCMGTVGVYAASKLIDKVTVGERTISSGNSEYVSDEEMDTSFKDDKVEAVSHEDGDDSVKWLTKDVQRVNDKVTNTYYRYADYKTALQEAQLPDWFSVSYESTGEATYCLIEDEGFTEKEVSAFLKYDEEKEFYFAESVMTGAVAEDCAFSLYLGNTKNKRDYKSSGGQEFTLVDSAQGEGEDAVTVTYVMIRANGIDGYVSFAQWKDEDIHKVLDSIVIP